ATQPMATPVCPAGARNPPPPCSPSSSTSNPSLPTAANGKSTPQTQLRLQPPLFASASALCFSARSRPFAPTSLYSPTSTSCDGQARRPPSPPSPSEWTQLLALPASLQDAGR